MHSTPLKRRVNAMRKILFIFILILFLPMSSQAMEIINIGGVEVVGDYVVGPGSYDLLLSPGESTTRNINVTNRTGKVLKVTVEIEDMTGDAQTGTKLLGSDRGPYSLKDFLHPEEMTFKLSHGERGVLPVNIDIPNDAEPGGLYGSVLIRVDTETPDVKEQVDGAAGQVTILSRVAVLFFVRIKGNTKEEGRLTSFTADKYFYQKSPVKFNIAYENTGRVHLNPYATVEIFNLMGKKIDEIDVAPWFVMPGVTRNRDVVWDKNLAFGKYTAKLKLNRGYQDLSDNEEISFWIVPMKILVISLSVILIIAIFLVWFSSKFEVRKK